MNRAVWTMSLLFAGGISDSNVEILAATACPSFPPGVVGSLPGINCDRGSVALGEPVGKTETRPGAHEAKTFLASGEYRSGEHVVGVFLTDREYARMLDDIEFHGIVFDWAWYEADYAQPTRPTRLRFRIEDFDSVFVAPVENYSTAIVSGLRDEIRRLFVHAMERLGSKVVDRETQAGLELGVAVVDCQAEATDALAPGVDPYIELEIRLRDAASREPLVLIRNRAHTTAPLQGAAATAAALIRVLR